MKKAGIILGIAIVMITMFLFVQQIYHPPLPIDTISAKEVIKKLEESDSNIVELVEEDEHIWYITKTEGKGTLTTDESIKEMIGAKGWTFKEKDGSGLFFEKDGERLIVTTEMWSSKYVLVKVPSEFKNL